MSRQWLPEVFLTIPDSGWPVEPGLPVGTGRVHDFTVEREIVAARMPGQVRARTGFSIGSASCAISQPAGRPLAPWAHEDRRVTAGQPCELYALDEATGERNDLGAWQVHAPAGSLVRGDVGIELYESQYAGRLADPRLPVVAGPVDAAWMVDQLARQAGFYSTPRPNAGTVLSVPLAGSLTPEVGTLAGGSQAAVTWSTRLGQIGVANDPTPRLAWNFTRPVTQSFRLAVTTPGAVFRIWLPSADSSVLVPVEVIAWTYDMLSIRINDGEWSSVPWTAGRNPNHPLRQEFEIAQSGSDVRVRVRSTDSDAAWSAWASVPRGDAELIVSGVEVKWQASQVAALQVGTGPLSWDPPTAKISLLDAIVDAPWLPEAPDVWTGLQQVCDSVSAAGWVSKDRVLTVRNRHEMAGSNRPKVLVDVGVRVEDLPWTVNADDYADRLTVTWWPVTWGDEFTGDFEQPVGEKLHVPAGRSVTVAVDLGQYVGTLFEWEHITSTAPPPFSEWQANQAADGSGTDVTSGISVKTDRLSPSRVRVTVTNSTATDAWMVDFDGNPGMILRGAGAVSQEAEQTIVYGVDDADAKQPLAVDLGKLVQRRETAEAIAAYLWERVNRPRYRVNGVRMPLDWTRDLGDILVLSHPESDLTANVLVVADRKTGDRDGIEHRCDLIVLPPTFSDFDTAWAGKTGADFDAVWAGRNGTAYDNDPIKTEA